MRGGTHVLLLVAVLLNNFAFSRALKPVGYARQSIHDTYKDTLTVLYEFFLVFGDTDVLFGQVTDLATFDFPKLFGNL